jgi:pimeloyl-ACP methyl ester carboxylesterase
MATSYLSKSLFIRGRQCHKSLWLHKNRPELRDEISDAQQAIFQSGTDVGILAQQLFPGGIEVPYDGLTHQQQIEQTRVELDKGTETIYEATFLHDGIFVKVDILHHGARGWEIYEVKGSTTLKDVYVFDAAIQYHALTGAGLDVSKVSIVHVNNSYTRYGDLDIRQLFTIKEITGQVQKLQSLVLDEVAAQRAMLTGEMPAIDIGKQCDYPYHCDFHGHCWQRIPEDSVFDLRDRGVNKFSLYRQGIIRQSDIPLEMLNSRQRFQMESTINQQDHLDEMKVKKFLDSLWYPLCFLDFETVNPAVPSFDGCRPYEKMPFQYSLHIQDSADAGLRHFEYLTEPGIDPRAELLDTLLERIPETACIIAWNQSFEISVLRGLAAFFPMHREWIERMIGNFRDLMQPFKSRDIYLWEAKGSYSIKPILPLLVPELSYKDLDGVANGGDAMDAYYRMNSTDDAGELTTIRQQLLDYCERDTEAMVRILEKMLKMVQKEETPWRETVIFFHGKESSPATSSSAKAVKEYFTGYDVLVPDYRPLERTHEEIDAFLTEFIEDAMKNDNIVHLVGISLGGYWAYTMGCKFREISDCILLNPSFRCYPDIPIVPPKPGLPISIIVNLDDDVVSPQEAIERFKGRAYIKTFNAGGHRFTNRDEMIGEVEKALNSIAG